MSPACAHLMADGVCAGETAVPDSAGEATRQLSEHVSVEYAAATEAGSSCCILPAHPESKRESCTCDSHRLSNHLCSSDSLRL
jgi:hypothetical protein